MSIIAKNITVGTRRPTVVNEESAKLGSRFKVFGKIITKQEAEPVKQEIFEVEKKEEVVAVTDESKYVHKQDGDLIRQLNKKSHYLRDLLELE